MKPAASRFPDSEVQAPDEAGSIETSTGTLVDTSWVNIALGIILAGGFYPCLLVAISSSIRIVFFLWRETVHGDSVPLLAALSAIWGLVLIACAAGLAGLVWTGILSIITLPFMYLIAWSLRLRGSIVLWGAFCGGIVGFLAVLPFILGYLRDAADRSNEFAAWCMALTVGPGITTILGQLGGAWGGRRAERFDRLYDHAVTLAIVDNPAASAGTSNTNSGGTSTNQPRLALQFGIRHLLWIAVWLSVLLSVIRLSGIPFEFVLPLLVGWLIYQAGTLWLGARLAPRFEPWWRGRRASRFM